MKYHFLVEAEEELIPGGTNPVLGICVYETKRARDKNVDIGCLKFDMELRQYLALNPYGSPYPTGSQKFINRFFRELERERKILDGTKSKRLG